MNKRQLKIVKNIRFTCPITNKKVTCRKNSMISTLLCNGEISLDEAIRLFKKCHIRHNLTQYENICTTVYKSLERITNNKNILFNLTRDIARSIVDIQVHEIYFNAYKGIVT